MLLTIRTISRPLLRATILLTGITITAWAGYSILDAYEGLAGTPLASLIAYWPVGLASAAAVTTLLILLARRVSRSGLTEETPWADIPDDLPMVAQFDASLRASGQDANSADDVPWSDIPDDLPMVTQFDASLRPSGQDASSVEDTPWADFPDDLPAVAQFDAYLRTHGRDAHSAENASCADIPNDLPAIAQFDAYLRTYSQNASQSRSWKPAFLRWLEEIPDAALARRELLRKTQSESEEYLRFYGSPGQLATAGANAMTTDFHGSKQMGDDQTQGQCGVTRRIRIRRTSDSQRIQ